MCQNVFRLRWWQSIFRIRLRKETGQKIQHPKRLQIQINYWRMQIRRLPNLRICQRIYNVIKVGDEGSMADQATKGPVNCQMEGSHCGFMLYDIGIFKDYTCDGTTTNFSLVIIKFGVEKESPILNCEKLLGKIM